MLNEKQKRIKNHCFYHKYGDAISMIVNVVKFYKWQHHLSNNIEYIFIYI